MDPLLNVSLEDPEGKELFERAKSFYAQQDYINALKEIEDLSFVNLNDVDEGRVRNLQGSIFRVLSQKADDTDVKFTYLLGSVETFWMDLGLAPVASLSLFQLAEHLDSVFYYRRAFDKANVNGEALQKLDFLKDIIKTSESKIAESKNVVASTVKKSKERVSESNEEEETSDSDLVNRLKPYWDALSVEVRRNFLKVSFAKFRSFVERLYGEEALGNLDQVLASAKQDRKWMFWLCRTCAKNFSSADECKNHFEQDHGAKVKLNTGNRVVEMISEARAQKISVGGWEPVDAEASAKMIKNQLEEVKAFAYENGWSQDWPLATDEERSKLLHEIQELLVSLYEHKVLPGSILGWIMDFVVKHLENFGVPEHILTECLLLETPQSICFLECVELNQILDFLKTIKCERNDGTDLVCRAVDSFCGGTRVKEKIDFDRKFSILLLDKRLLQGKIAQLDDEGTCNVLNPNAHYTKERAHGDYILSWLADNSSRYESFRFSRSIWVHNLDIWVAVLRAIQFTSRTLGAKYRKKLMVLCFDASLDEVKKLCILEDERRRNIPEDQRTSYATLICDKYEKLTARDSLAARVDLSVARQVLEAASVPTFDCPDSEDSLNVIREHRTATDDSVLISIENLKLVVNNKIFYKVPRMDTKILLIEKSRINLLNQLIKLSVVDYRSYILGPLKNFLLQGILDIESKAKTAAENAALLLKEEEEEKKPPSKKKKNKRNKKNSTSISSPLDTIVEREPEDTVSSERDQLKVSSNTNNQEKVAKGDPGCEKASQLTDMPGENSRSKHLESAHGAAATRCDSALEMTLKALCNIKVLKEYLVQNKDQFPDDLQEQVPSLIQGYFVAFASEQIEQVHSYFVENLLACLEPREAAGVLLSILEFWPCWKNPEIESVVTHLFTLDEYETMSCCKCGKNPNYPEQSSYGMVMAADSIRELKCDFENMKFYDILKMTRMEDKMLCECGKANFVHRIMTTCPFIFTIVLEWVKDETAEEISETAKALDREIDISKIYEGLKPNTKYRLVSMVGYGEEEGYICLACKTNKWFCLKEGVGDWKDVVRFCVDRKVRPEILFYEAVWSMA